MFDLKHLESSEFYHRRTQNFATLIISPILGIFVFILVFSLFFKKELTVKSTASIEPTKVVQIIQSTSSGNILENNLKEGLSVNPGQVLVHYDISSDVTQQTDFQAQLAKAQHQKSQLVFLENSLNSGSNQFPNADSFGYYQSFEDYLAQVSVITDNVNKSNQAVRDQNTSNSNIQSAIQDQVSQLNQQISNLKNLINMISTNNPDPANPYYSQFMDYQNQLANLESQTQTVKSQFSTTIQSSMDQTQSQIDSLNLQIVQLDATNIDTRNQLAQQIATLQKQLQNYQQVKNASSSSAISSQNPYKSQYDALQSQIASINSQESSLKSQAISNLQGQVDTIQGQIDALKTQSAGLTQNNGYDNSLDGQLKALKSEALLKANQDLTTLGTTISDLQTKLKLLSQTSQDGTLKASSAGVLHVLSNVLGVKKIGVGTEIAEVYPAFNENSQIKLTAYIPASQISAISVGRNIRFQVQQNLPKPVILSGKVTKIDSAATKSSKGNFYGIEVMIILKKSDLNKVRYGLEGQITIVTGKKSYFDYYKDKILGND